MIDFMKRGLCNMGKNNPATQVKYNKEHYDTILVRFKKETNLKDRLKDASILTRKTVNEIVQSAILEWLNENNL